MRYVNLLFNLQSMKIRDSPKIAFKSIKNNTSKFYTIESEESGKVFIEFDYIIRNTNISKKQLDLYLWRNKDKFETHKE